MKAAAAFSLGLALAVVAGLVGSGHASVSRNEPWLASVLEWAEASEIDLSDKIEIKWVPSHFEGMAGSDRWK